MRRAPPSSSAVRSLRRLRFRLTAWYVGTFAAVLIALGTLLFAGLVHSVSSDLDASLRMASEQIAIAARDGGKESEQRAKDAAVAEVSELQIQGRKLYLFDLTGHPLVPASADSVVRKLALNAAANGTSSMRWEAPDDQTLQAYAERFSTERGETYVAAAVVDRDLIDDQYATLVGLTGVLGALGLVLVAVGGWALARQSVGAVEHSMEQTRQFMADAAHELRTPVSVIRSRVDVTLEQPRDAEGYARVLTELREEIERLTLLVNDLFTLARADSDERAFVPVRVQLDELVLESVTTAGWIGARRKVTLYVEEAEEAVIEGDPALLRQLVLIVLENAIKFSNADGVVTIALRVTGESAMLVVEDNGVGIAQADVERVFDRFYRAESVRGATAGAGLGLAIAKWIADVHGARIALEPAPTRGTRATVRFSVVSPKEVSRHRAPTANRGTE